MKFDECITFIVTPSLSKIWSTSKHSLGTYKVFLAVTTKLASADPFTSRIGRQDDVRAQGSPLSLGNQSVGAEMCRPTHTQSWRQFSPVHLHSTVRTLIRAGRHGVSRMRSPQGRGTLNREVLE